MAKKKKILITGGAGYIGTVLIPKLLDRGYQVTVYDSLLFGGNALIPFFRNPNFSFIKGDVRDKIELSRAIKGADVVIHLAAIVGYPACRENPDLAHSTNVLGTQNVASSVSKNQYVLFGSTSSNYGEIKSGICTEETPLNPVSIYGETKTEAEQIVMEQTTATAFRFATAFGLSPRLRLDLMLNDFCYQAVKQKYFVVYESHFMRSFIHVDDMTDAFILAIDKQKKMQGEVYNVGGNKMNYSKKQVSEMIAKESGARVHYASVSKDAEKRNFKVSYAKIKKLGFEPKISVREGIKEMVKALPAIKITNPYSNAS